MYTVYKTTGQGWRGALQAAHLPLHTCPVALPVPQLQVGINLAGCAHARDCTCHCTKRPHRRLDYPHGPSQVGSLTTDDEVQRFARCASRHATALRSTRGWRPRPQSLWVYTHVAWSSAPEGSQTATRSKQRCVQNWAIRNRSAASDVHCNICLSSAVSAAFTI